MNYIRWYYIDPAERKLWSVWHIQSDTMLTLCGVTPPYHSDAMINTLTVIYDAPCVSCRRVYKSRAQSVSMVKNG